MISPRSTCRCRRGRAAFYFYQLQLQLACWGCCYKAPYHQHATHRKRTPDEGRRALYICSGSHNPVSIMPVSSQLWASALAFCGASAENMNGQYQVASVGNVKTSFNDDYSSKGHEYFDVVCCLGYQLLRQRCVPASILIWLRTTVGPRNCHALRAGLLD